MVTLTHWKAMKASQSLFKIHFTPLRVNTELNQCLNTPIIIDVQLSAFATFTSYLHNKQISNNFFVCFVRNLRMPRCIQIKCTHKKIIRNTKLMFLSLTTLLKLLVRSFVIVGYCFKRCLFSAKKCAVALLI